jgi:hypothetical protein
MRDEKGDVMPKKLAEIMKRHKHFRQINIRYHHLKSNGFPEGLINLLRPVFFCFFFFLTALNWFHVPFVQDDFGFSIIPNLLPLLLTAGIDTLCPAQTINHFVLNCI